MAALVALTLALALTAAVTATAKECTNIPTELSSHTVRARLQAAPGGAAEWRWRELFHEHLNPTDEAAWMDLMPPPGAAAAAQHQQHHRQEELDWVMLYRSLKGQQQQQPVGGGTAAAGSTPFLEEVSLHDVRLDPDGDVAYGRAQQTNLEYLLLLDVDRLVWSFRSQAGLPAPGTPYGGWEKPDSELRGHFVGTCSVSLSCPPNHAHAEMLRRHALSSGPGHGHYFITWWCSGRQPSRLIIHGHGFSPKVDAVGLVQIARQCDMGVERLVIIVGYVTLSHLVCLGVGK
jgi:hypothetical protein